MCAFTCALHMHKAHFSLILWNVIWLSLCVWALWLYRVGVEKNNKNSAFEYIRIENGW